MANEEHNKQSKDDEVTIDFKKFSGFFSKAGIFLLILIPLFISIWLHISPLSLPAMDNYASSNLDNAIINSFQQQVIRDYPSLPAENRDAEAIKLANEYIVAHKDEIVAQKKANADFLRSQFQMDDGTTYLLDIDSYVYFRQARNIFNNGQPGETVKDGKPYDILKEAPFGGVVGFNFHPWFASVLFKLAGLFNKNINFVFLFAIVPWIVVALAVIPAFFIGKRLAGNVGGFFTALLIAIHPYIIARTVGPDTDCYNVLFPVLLVCFIVEAFYSKTKMWKYIFAGLTGLTLGVYSFAWGGWWYFFYFLSVSFIVSLAWQAISHYVLKKEKHSLLGNVEFKTISLLFGMFIVSSGIFVSLFSGFSTFIRSPLYPFQFSIIKDPVHATLWPNVYTTVAELNPANLNEIVNSVGSLSTLLFLLAVCGILAFLFFGISGKKFKVYEDDSAKLFFGVLLLFWFGATIYASLKGSRFILLLAPGFAIALGATVGLIYDWIFRSVSNKMTGNILRCTFVFVFIILLMPTFMAAYQTSSQQMPLMNDGWYNSLINIKDNSKNDSIINSWWDFGHQFAAIAERPITFDGGSQNSPMAYWIGKTLLTSSEDDAMGTLRMLDCGSRMAGDNLTELYGNDTVKTVDVLNKIILMDKSDAIDTLEKSGLTKDQANSIVSLTHCTPPDDYFITSGDMVGKSGVWAHFGGWDFKRAKIWNNVANLKKMSNEEGIKFVKDLGYSDADAESLYYDVFMIKTDDEANRWVAAWPSYFSDVTSCSDSGNNTVTCGSVRVDLNDFTAKVGTNNGVVTAYSVVYPGKENIVEKVSDNNSQISVGLIKDANGKFSSAFLMDKSLAKSMFTVLFFYNGYGLKHFDHVSYTRDVQGSEIFVWKVDWSGSDANTEYTKPADTFDKSAAVSKEQVKASHILVSFNNRTEEQASNLINEIAKNATADNFAELAKKYSEDPGSAVNGGELGWFGKGMMVSEFEKAAFDTKVGEISKPVRTQFGYHVILVEDKK